MSKVLCKHVVKSKHLIASGYRLPGQSSAEVSNFLNLFEQSINLALASHNIMSTTVSNNIMSTTILMIDVQTG